MVFEAAAWRAEQERKRAVVLAWQVAALSRSRQIPSLRRLLGADKTRALSGEELARREREFAELTARMGDGRK